MPTRACCAPRCAWCVAILPVRVPIARNLPWPPEVTPRVGFACLAEALAGEGNLDRALALLDAASAQHADADASARAYLLAMRARAARTQRAISNGAIVDYGEALKLAPRDDSIRAALADALVARGDTGDARELLAIEKPSLALLVRSAALSEGARRAELSARAAAWLALEAARGDSPHYREAALLALVNGDAARRPGGRTRNFEMQKELADVRVLARAARAAHDAAALSDSAVVAARDRISRFRHRRHSRRRRRAVRVAS